MAAGMPIAVARMAVSEPRTSEFLNAPKMVALWASFTYHFKLKLSIGKDPNCSGLNDKSTTATIGANIQR